MLGYPYYHMAADNTGDYQQQYGVNNLLYQQYKYNHGDNNQQYQQQHQQQHQKQQHPRHHEQQHPQQYQQHQQQQQQQRRNHGPPLLQNVEHERMKRSSDLRKSLDASQQHHSKQISELEELGSK